MPSRNPAWLNANETRPYPLADSGTLRSVRDERLPHDILVDLNLRYPNDIGVYPYLASVGVTEQLVSLTVQAASSLDDTASLAPVAALGLLKANVVEGRPYALQSQYPGAGGWVIFGSGIQETFSGRFLGPRSTLLAPRVARAYRKLPVESLSKLGTLTALTGLVRLSGRSPIEVVKEEREVLGVNRDVIVVRLVQPVTSASVADEQSVFRQFLGLCSGRPESRSCGDPQPIEFINTVRPDCDGNINIEFQGCAQLSRVLDGIGGVMLDCELGLGEACEGDRLPSIDGVLRTEYPDECVYSEVSESFVSESLVSESEVTTPSTSAPVGSLPYTECWFLNDSGYWDTISGEFAFADGVSPDNACPAFSASDSFSGAGDQSYQSQSAAQRNISVWNGFDDTTLNRRFSADFLMVSGIPGSKRNAGLILNYRESLTTPGFFQYYLAELDYDSQELRIKRWNGSNFSPSAASVTLPGLSLDLWYRMVVEITPGAGSTVDISVSLNNVDAPSLSASLGPLNVNNFLPDTGVLGIHGNRAISSFTNIKVEDIS